MHQNSNLALEVQLLFNLFIVKTLPDHVSLRDVVTLSCPTGLCIMIAASIYTAELHISEEVGGYGHCYVLAWISFVLSFILAVTYLVLRKKSE